MDMQRNDPKPETVNHAIDATANFPSASEREVASQQEKAPAPIYTAGSDLDAVLEKLIALTNATAKSHTVHDFSIPVWGSAVVSLFPYEESGKIIAKMFLHSPVPLKDGDMIVTRGSRGRMESFAFDVKQLQNPNDLYEVNVVKNSPQAGIGHLIAEKE